MPLKHHRMQNPTRFVVEEAYYSGDIEEIASKSVEMPPEIHTIRRMRLTDAIKIIGEERWKQILAFMYVDLKMSIRAIATKLGKSYSTIDRWIWILEREGILKARIPKPPKRIGKLVPSVILEKAQTEIIDREYVRVYYVYPFPELCYIIGFCIGDGSVHRTTRREVIYEDGIRLYNTEFGLLNPVLEKARKVAEKFDVKPIVKYHNRMGVTVKRIEDAYLWEIIIWSSALARLISNEKEFLVRHTLKTLLKEPFKGDFLAGLWDADGSISNTHVELDQAETNKPLLTEISNALNKQNISTSSPYLKASKGKTTEFYGKTLTSIQPIYAILIHLRSIPKWIKLIGRKMNHPKKRERIIELTEKLLQRGLT